MKVYTQLCAVLLILISLYYLRWFFIGGDSITALLAINLFVVSLLLLSLPSDKWNVRPWFKDTRFGCKWPLTSTGWSVSITMVVAIILTLMIADSRSQAAGNMLALAIPFIGTIIASWLAIQHMRS